MSNFKKFIINELEQTHLDRIEDYLEDLLPEDLPFDDIFQNKYREVTPFEDSKLATVKNLIKDYYNSESFPQLVDHKVDWSTGQIVNKFRNKNAGQTVVDKKTREEKIIPEFREKRTNIAKFLKNSNREDLLPWWSNFMDNSAISPKERESIADSTGKFSIVFTRHPIDILRMSDHRNISSCHSPDGMEFKSCKQETVDGGGMAFLVDTEDLKDIDLNSDEIFEDDDRDIDGIEPKSRIRIRRYTSKFEDEKTGEKFDFAVPETTVYGTRSEEFKTKVLEFFQKKQEDLIQRNGGRENFRIENFTLRGGKYRDSSDASLFNKFFNDNKDKGNTSYSYEGKEEFVDLREQYIEELDEIENDYNNNVFQHSKVSYYPFDDYGENAPFYYSMSGYIEIPVPLSMITKEPEEDDITGHWRNDEDVSLRGTLDDHGINISKEYTNITSSSDTLWITLSKDSNDGGYDEYYSDDGLHPDAFTDFCNEFKSELDDNFEQIIGLTKHWLIEQGFAEQTPARVLEDKIFDEELKLQNFQLADRDMDEPDVVEVFADARLMVNEPEWPDASDASASGRIGVKKKLTNLQMDQLMSQIENMFMGTINSKYSNFERQKWLPIVKKPVNPYQHIDQYAIEEGLPEIKITSDYSKKIEIEASFYLHDDDSKEKIAKLEVNLVQLDRSWSNLVAKSQEIISRYFRGIEEDLLLKQKQNQDQQKLSGLLGSKNQYWSVKPNPTTQKQLYPEPKTKGDEYRDMILKRGKYAPKQDDQEN